MKRSIKIVLSLIVAVFMFGLALTSYRMKKPFFAIVFSLGCILALVPMFPTFKPGGDGGGSGGGAVNCKKDYVCIKDTCPSNIFVRPDGLTEDGVQAISRGSGAERCVNRMCFERKQVIRVTSISQNFGKGCIDLNKDGRKYFPKPRETETTIMFPQNIMVLKANVKYPYKATGNYDKPIIACLQLHIPIPVVNDSIADIRLIRAAWLCYKGKPGGCESGRFGKNKQCGFTNDDDTDKHWLNDAGEKYGKVSEEQLKKLGEYIYKMSIPTIEKYFSHIWGTQDCEFYFIGEGGEGVEGVEHVDVKYYPGVYTDKPETPYDIEADLPDPLPDKWIVATPEVAQEMCGTGIPDDSGGSSSVFWTRGDTSECKLDPYNQPYSCNEDEVVVNCIGNNDDSGPNCGAQWMDLPLSPPDPDSE
jgi:hypothetical protein